jgi:arabinose-5-phosphate isomerase
MQSINEVAIVDKDDKLRKVVIAMTEKPQGAALVVDQKLQLLGIITEGDLRRSLADGKDIDKITVVDLMTPNPIAINIKSPLKDAIILMEDRESQISVLPVINDDGKTCAGLLRLHDIYQTNLF